jgi:DNA-binding MarR family transcriptional regulator
MDAPFMPMFTETHFLRASLSLYNIAIIACKGLNERRMNDEQTGLKLDDLIGYNMRRASTAMLNDFGGMFAETTIRPTSFSVACVIGEQPGITSAEICRILGLQRANIVTLLAELENLGAIRRVDDEEDRRSQQLYLSESGGRDLATWREMAIRHEARSLTGLSTNERKILLNMLRRIWRDDA